MSESSLPQPLRLVDLRFVLCLGLPVLVILHALHMPQLAASGTVLMWLGIALGDQFWPGARHSPAPRALHALHPLVLRLYVPLQLLMLGVACAMAVGTAWPVLLGLGFAAGWVSGSLGITFAHELGHGRSRLDRALGWVLMTSVCYSHFMVEHYRGHHPRAATHDDPATARRGESLYRFLPRTLLGSWLSAWRLEAARIAQMGALRCQQGHAPDGLPDRASGRPAVQPVLALWLRSPLLWTQLGSAALLGVLGALWGAPAVVFWLAQSAVAVLLLETVNYIEHYGLVRGQREGRREAFGHRHAWNADHALSNALLVNLQRHSDHHMHAWKPYPELDDLPDTPRLPTGYAGCLLLAAVPPLWFTLMHRRLDALQAQPAAAVGVQERG